MLRTRRVGAVLGVLLLAALVLTAPLRGQVPGAPAVPAVPGAPALPGAGAGAAAGAGGAAGAPAAAPKNIWSFFMKTPEQKAQMKACFCNSKIGQFINNMLLPASAATGGLLGPLCPPPGAPKPEDLAKPATSAQGAAAKIKAEEAQAKAKIGAIEYLATVDCRYYPEAEAALINGLRAEKNECVRIAAAKALATGCCCSAKVVKALTISANCSTKDGFPAEASELVRCYAYVALERCLRKCIETEPEVPPEPPPAAKKAMYESLAPMGGIPDYTATVLLAAYYSPEGSEPAATVYVAARATLARGMQLSPQTVARLSGPRNVRDALMADPRPTSFSLPQVTTPPQPAAMKPATQPFTQEPPRALPATVPVTATVAPEVPAAAPAAPVVPQAVPEKKPSRGNILHMVKDAFRK